jgi:hypothetical protein
MTQLHLLVVLTLLTGCQKEEVGAPPRPTPAPAPSAAPAKRIAIDGVAGGGGVRTQVRLGGGDVDDQPRLGFKITHAYEKQQPSEQAPWHKDGGEWTFFDAETEGGDPASFSFGFMSMAPANSPFGFGDGLLVTADRAQATRFLTAFGKAFRQPVPPAAADKPVAPLRMKLAVLGRNIGRDPAGGLGGRGDWTATKLFPQLDRVEGEVFFNFSLGAKQGELAEKDTDYNKDVMTVFATIRDGAPTAKKR